MAFNSQDTALARRLHSLTTHEVEDIARQAGTSWCQINRWVSGSRSPGVLNAIRLARVLGTTVEELFGDAAQV